MQESIDVQQLNSFLRGEISAIESYEHCLEHIDDLAVISQLKGFQASHRRRAELLSARIRSLGGTPSEASGVWGGLAKVVQRGAGILGGSAAVSALEEGEELGVKGYREEVVHLSPPERQFVNEKLLPEQVRTRNALRLMEMK
jgi:hypothetical protein